MYHKMKPSINIHISHCASKKYKLAIVINIHKTKIVIHHKFHNVVVDIKKFLEQVSTSIQNLVN